MQDRIEALCCRIRRGEGAPLGQAEVNHHLPPVRRGEELLRHAHEPGDRGGEGEHGSEDHDPAPAHAPANDPAEAAIDRRIIDRVRVGDAVLRLRQQRRAEVGHEQDGDDPGEHQGQADDAEDVLRVFARAGPGEADGEVARRGDERARQHRESGAGPGEGAGAHPVPTLLQLHRHGLDGDDRVVHEQTQGDDHGAERDALQVDTEQPHGHEHAGEHERHADRDDDPGAPTQRQEADQQHDAEGCEEAALELAHVLADDLGLVVDAGEVDAEGKLRLDLVQAGGDALAEVEDVAAVRHGDGECQRRVAVMPDRGGGRVHGAAANGGDLAERDQVALRLAPLRPDWQLADRLHAGRGLAEAEGDAVGAGVHEAARRHGVLLADRGEEVVRGQAELGEALIGELDVDALVLLAEKLDLADAGHGQEALAHVLGDVAKLGEGEAVALDGIDEAVHVAELVVEEGALHAVRQHRAQIAELLANLIPEIGHAAGGVLSLSVIVTTVCPARVSLTVLSRKGSSSSLRSMGSATSRAMVSALAPGQSATTTMFLIVKPGSSARPRPK